MKPASLTAMAVGLSLFLPPLAISSASAQSSTAASIVLPTDRTVLPIPEPQLPADHRARCPEREGPAALRGEGARRTRPTC